jgi:Ricin-type beta-trefoil lectin domain
MRRILYCLLAVAAAVGVSAAQPAFGQSAPTAQHSVGAAGSAAPAPTRRACAVPLRPHGPVCYAQVRTDIRPLTAAALAPNATPSGYGPSDLRSAYKLPSASAGSGQTVAVMELADDPNLESDLGAYRSQFGLPACTTANGCFAKVNQNGQQGNYPGGDPGWGLEASLDVDMVSAICPNCHIIVVEAGDLNAAQNTAVSLGAHYLSNSWGTGDGSGDAGGDADYNHAGVVDVASSGDGGYGVSFPATSKYVVAAGGTSLRRDSSARGWSETAWSGSGAGCSSWESKPSWQHDSGCGTRTVADASAVADPGTGVAVYDTYGQGGWLVVGGTSASSPILASTYALAANPPTGQSAASTLYANPGSLNDVTSGSDGSCSPSYLCTAGSGYDGPTGLGTPNGLGAFGGSAGGGGPIGQITGYGGLCVDDRSSVTTNFNPIQIWGCNNSGAQQWTVVQAGSTLHVLGKCMDINNGGTANGTAVDLYDCNNTGSQVFIPRSDGSLYNPQSGRCLDDTGWSTSAGTQLEIWDCTGGANQKWNLP